MKVIMANLKPSDCMCGRCMFWAVGHNCYNGQCFVFQYAPIDTKFNDVCNGFEEKHEVEYQEALDKEGGA